MRLTAPARRQVVRVALLASVAAWLFATRAFIAVEPLRLRAIQQPASAAAGTVRVDLPDTTTALRPPFAVIARMRNDSPARLRLTIRLDDLDICTADVAPASSRRIDCAARAAWTSSAHHVSIEGPNAQWALEYLELATHHGRSTGAFDAFVLPRGSTVYTSPSLLWIAVAWLAAALFFLVEPRGSGGRTTRVLARTASTAAALLAAICAIAPFLSPYLVLLSPGTWVLLLLLSSPGRVWRALGAVQRFVARGASERPGRRLRAAATKARGALGRAWFWTRAHEPLLVVLLALLVTVTAALCGSRAVGGADSYGYLSQAELWLKGNLKIDQPFVRELPWPRVEFSFAPLGYMPDPADPTHIVPTYSPGLPMLLAAAKLMGGQEAVFWVVPISTGLLVLATYGVGRRLGAGSASLAGAWLTATSPTVLIMATSVMTDVPVAAAWAGAVYLLLGQTRASAAGAGLLSGFAVLIRPNLAPLVGVLALRYVFELRNPLERRTAFIRLLLFGIAAVPGIGAVAALNAYWYGSPARSGYGPLSELFSLQRVPVNLRLYLAWLAESHTIVALAGFVVLFVPLRRFWPGVRDRTIFIVLGLFVVVVWAIYCAWVVFDVWWFTRFLLSSWPFIMLAVGALAAAVYRASPAWLRPLVIVAVAVLGLWQLRFTDREYVFETRAGHRRFSAFPQLVRRVTDRNSVIISLDYSGAMRYYGGRMTINFSQLPENWLDAAVESLAARGVRTYLAVEEWELPEVRQRFQRNRRLALVDAPPVAIYEHPGRALLFDLTEAPPPGSVPAYESDSDAAWYAQRPAPPPRLVLK